MQRIFIDSQVSRIQKRGGISNYRSRLSNLISAKTEFLVVRNLLKADVVHHTFYIPFYPTVFNKKPKVVTVYDFIPESGTGFRQRRAHMAKSWYLKNSDGVIYISDTVRRKAENLGYRPKIWAVTPLASRFSYPKSEVTPRNRKQLLYVGNRAGYKNFHVIPQAIHAANVAGLSLVIVGGKKLSKSERRELENLDLDCKHLPGVSDSELEKLYLESGICLIPSLKEGFGLPMVEAMSLGCPVVASDTEITNEVGEEAVLKISQSDPKEWAKAIDALVADDRLWDKYSKAGIDQSKIFKWDKTAEITANLYKRVLEASGAKKS